VPIFVSGDHDGVRDTAIRAGGSHRATVCCHLATISYLTGRKIRWDGQTETIAGDEEAARLLTRPRRNGYELPAV
jgi:hypothetical protein